MKAIPVFYSCGHVHPRYVKDELKAAGLKENKPCCTAEYNPATVHTIEMTQDEVEREFARRNPHQLNLL